MKPIILIGGGGHCKSVIDVIELEGKYKIAGIIDKPVMVGKSILGYKVIGSDDDLVDLFKKYKYALITIGQINSAQLRIKMYNNLKKLGFLLPIIISPNAYVSSHSSVEEGTVIMHNVLVNSNVKIGINCIINSKALIEHDCIIGDNCHLSTGSIINGNVIIGNGSFIGSNVVTKHEVQILENSFIKAGSVVK